MIKFLRFNRSAEDWHPSEGELVDYADGQMPRKQAARIRTHLGVCWSCRTKAERIQETISTFVDYLENAFTSRIESPPQGWRTFEGALSKKVATASKGSLLSHVRCSLAKIFRVPKFSVRLATGISVLLFLGFLLNRSHPVPPVSANELLQRATEAQACQIRAVARPVVYQKQQVRRQAEQPIRDNITTSEIWNDASKNRFKQRVEDSNGQRFIDSQIEDGGAGGSETQGLLRFLLPAMRHGDGRSNQRLGK
jgi:anti-sigma factor RsiW